MFRKGDKVTVNHGYGRIYTVERTKTVGVSFPHEIVYLKETGERFPVSDLTKYMEPLSIEDQTIMFWNLQLQFMDLRPVNLQSIYCAVMVRDFYKDQVYSIDHGDMATELALQLSGLA